MRSILISLVFVMTFAFAAFAQDAPKNVIAVQGVYNRQGVDLKIPNRGEFRYDADRDSIGGEFSYTRFVAGPLGIGIEGGVTFHDKAVGTIGSCGAGCVVSNSGRSKVARGYAHYSATLQDRKGAFQPFVKGVIGIQRGNFDGISVGPGGSFRAGGGSSFTYGGGGGIDIKLGKGTFWRTELQLTRAFNDDTKQWNAAAKTGLAFKF